MNKYAPLFAKTKLTCKHVYKVYVYLNSDVGVEKESHSDHGNLIDESHLSITYKFKVSKMDAKGKFI